MFQLTATVFQFTANYDNILVKDCKCGAITEGRWWRHYFTDASGSM